MASGHVNRTNRPNTWLHRPATRREDSPCQLGAVHTWHFLPSQSRRAMSVTGGRFRHGVNRPPSHRLDRPTYAQCEFFAFWTHCGHKQGRNTAAQQVSCRTELCYPFSGKTRGACSACPYSGNSGLAERLARADEVIE